MHPVLVALLGLAPAGYDPIRDTTSELGAVDSPVRTPMNLAGFAGLGVAILAAAVSYQLVLGRSRWAAPSALLLAGSGLAMVATAFLPCDPGCVDVTTVSSLHSLTSTIGAIGLPAAAMLSAAVFVPSPVFGTRWALASFWTGAVAMAAGPLVGLGLVPDALGLVQRAAMGLGLAWLLAVSVRLLVATRPDAAPT